MRVLVLLGGIPLHGRERANIQVFHSLSSAGVDCLFVTHREYGHENIQPALDRRELSWTVATFPGMIGRGLSIRDWFDRAREIYRSNREVLRIAREYRPTHLHICSEERYITLAPVLRMLRLPVIYRLGDAPRQHSAVYRLFWRHLIGPGVDRFVCVSEYIRGKVIAAGVPAEKVQVIYTHPQVRVPLRPGETLGGSAGETDGDRSLDEVLSEPFAGRTFVYMGQLTSDKGVDLLVEAALGLCGNRRDVRFLLAGDYLWENPFAEGLIEQVRAAGLADRIRFLGYVQDVPRLLAAADCHVCPSVWEEPLSNTVVEAKAASIPSVVFSSGGLPELVTDGLDGSVISEKTGGALAASLLSWLEKDDHAIQAAGRAASESLGTMGITTQAFSDAWYDAYAGCSADARPHHPGPSQTGAHRFAGAA